MRWGLDDDLFDRERPATDMLQDEIAFVEMSAVDIMTVLEHIICAIVSMGSMVLASVTVLNLHIKICRIHTAVVSVRNRLDLRDYDHIRVEPSPFERPVCLTLSIVVVGIMASRSRQPFRSSCSIMTSRVLGMSRHI
jgi:hypothetical protein